MTTRYNWTPGNNPTCLSFEAREEVTQTVTVLLPADTLIFAAPQPRRVSVATRADANIMADGVTEMSQLITYQIADERLDLFGRLISQHCR